ncbi:hypothetical protein L1N85_18950 [Paenibacillus alkaliterrae]|uniref:hypothetical protein n=1 Tax=Paenibacillus alkaliterrae TaxID=320909 RepID=UPI001F2573EB|nr:hypothetical protein [Paenibacillus alkaliterrae]MCF2940475.1 hypothetical protein [Paenibacillus alkaliterrae]
MNFKLGMRIPPKIGSEGIEKAAKWASGIQLDVLDVPALTPEVKRNCDTAGIGIGSVDAVHMSQLLSKDDSRRANAVEEVKKQMTEMAPLGGRVMFMCLVPEDHSLPRRESFAIWKDTFPDLIRHAEREGVGHGQVKWDQVAVRLERIGYRGAISIELEDHRYWGSIESERQGIVKAVEHLELYFK